LIFNDQSDRSAALWILMNELLPCDGPHQKNATMRQLPAASKDDHIHNDS